MSAIFFFFSFTESFASASLTFRKLISSLSGNVFFSSNAPRKKESKSPSRTSSPITASPSNSFSKEFRHFTKEDPLANGSLEAINYTLTSLGVSQTTTLNSLASAVDQLNFRGVFFSHPQGNLKREDEFFTRISFIQNVTTSNTDVLSSTIEERSPNFFHPLLSTLTDSSVPLDSLTTAPLSHQEASVPLLSHKNPTDNSTVHTIYPSVVPTPPRAFVACKSVTQEEPQQIPRALSRQTPSLGFQFYKKPRMAHRLRSKGSAKILPSFVSTYPSVFSNHYTEPVSKAAHSTFKDALLSVPSSLSLKTPPPVVRQTTPIIPSHLAVTTLPHKTARKSRAVLTPGHSDLITLPLQEALQPSYATFTTLSHRTARKSRAVLMTPGHADLRTLPLEGALLPSYATFTTLSQGKLRSARAQSKGEILETDLTFFMNLLQFSARKRVGHMISLLRPPLASAPAILNQPSHSTPPFYLLPKEKTSPRNFKPAFFVSYIVDNFLLVKLIMFYNHLLLSYESWESQERAKFHRVTQDLHNQTRELTELEEEIREDDRAFLNKKQSLNKEVKRINSTINKNEKEKNDLIEEIRNTIKGVEVRCQKFFTTIEKKKKKISEQIASLEIDFSRAKDEFNSEINKKETVILELRNQISQTKCSLVEQEQKAYDKAYLVVKRFVEAHLNQCVKKEIENARALGLKITEENINIEEKTNALLNILKSCDLETVETTLSYFKKALPNESAYLVDEKKIVINEFRSAAQTLDAVRLTAKKSANVIKLRKKLKIAIAQLEELHRQDLESDAQFSTQKQKLEESISAFLATGELYERFKLYSTTVANAGETELLTLMKELPALFSSMQQFRSMREFAGLQLDEDNEKLQWKQQSLRENIETGEELKQKLRAKKVELTVFEETYDDTMLSKYERLSLYKDTKEWLEEDKKTKKLRLDGAHKIAKALAEDASDLEEINDACIQYTKNLNVGTVVPLTQKQAEECSKFSKKFECKFTSRGQFSFLASYWNDYRKANFETSSQQEPAIALSDTDDIHVNGENILHHSSSHMRVDGRRKNNYVHTHSLGLRHTPFPEDFE